MEFPTIDKFAKGVAEKALDEITYEGKTIREWAEIIAKQELCEDCISRKTTLKAFAEKCGGECGCCDYNGSGYDTAENCKLIKSMPSVIPKQKAGKWEEIGIVMEGRMYEHGECDMQDAWICDYCGYQVHMPTKYCPNCGSYNGGEDE